MSIFEAGMLICFGLGWPVSIIKSLRTKMVQGKSPLFMAIVLIGYLCGILHKVFHSPDWITGLYTLNFIMIAFDLFLYVKYLPNTKQRQRDAGIKGIKPPRCCHGNSS